MQRAPSPELEAANRIIGLPPGPAPSPAATVAVQSPGPAAPGPATPGPAAASPEAPSPGLVAEMKAAAASHHASEEDAMMLTLGRSRAPQPRQHSEDARAREARERAATAAEAAAVMAEQAEQAEAAATAARAEATSALVARAEAGKTLAARVAEPRTLYAASREAEERAAAKREAAERALEERGAAERGAAAAVVAASAASAAAVERVAAARVGPPPRRAPPPPPPDELAVPATPATPAATSAPEFDEAAYLSGRRASTSGALLGFRHCSSSFTATPPVAASDCGRPATVPAPSGVPPPTAPSSALLEARGMARVAARPTPGTPTATAATPAAATTAAAERLRQLRTPPGVAQPSSGAAGSEEKPAWARSRLKPAGRDGGSATNSGGPSLTELLAADAEAKEKGVLAATPEQEGGDGIVPRRRVSISGR